MSSNAILFPLFAMALLTLFISMRLLQLRYRAVIQDGLNPRYFKHNRGAKPPEYVMRMEDHYTNTYEQPVLFYVVIILIYITSQADLVLLLMAWLYVATRILHAYIHIRYNKIIWRRNAFLLSTLVVFTLWGYLFVQLINQ